MGKSHPPWAIIKDEIDMEAKRENIKNCDRGDSRRLGCVRNCAIALIFLPFLFSGCVHWPDIATECDAYGVREDHQPLGSLIRVEAVYGDELEIRCAAAKVAAVRNHPDLRIRGCVIPYTNGMVYAYYSVNDRCAMYHEMCHAIHGLNHTDRYLQDLEKGTPMPYCPGNQLGP